MAKGGNIMNDITYKNYLISIKEGMIVVKIKGGVGGWVLHFPDKEQDWLEYTKNHIDNQFSVQDKKNGRI
jgi:hypothetical protein